MTGSARCSPSSRPETGVLPDTLSDHLEGEGKAHPFSLGEKVDARSADGSRRTAMKSALPIATVVLALIAVWYVAAALMNAPLQRDQFANAGRADYSAQDLVGASLNMERPKLPAPHQVASRALQARPRHRADLEAQPRLPRS